MVAPISPTPLNGGSTPPSEVKIEKAPSMLDYFTKITDASQNLKEYLNSIDVSNPILTSGYRLGVLDLIDVTKSIIATVTLMKTIWDQIRQSQQEMQNATNTYNTTVTSNYNQILVYKTQYENSEMKESDLQTYRQNIAPHLAAINAAGVAYNSARVNYNNAMANMGQLNQALAVLDQAPLTFTNINNTGIPQSFSNDPNSLVNRVSAPSITLIDQETPDPSEILKKLLTQINSKQEAIELTNQLSSSLKALFSILTGSSERTEGARLSYPGYTSIGSPSSGAGPISTILSAGLGSPIIVKAISDAMNFQELSFQNRKLSSGAQDVLTSYATSIVNSFLKVAANDAREKLGEMAGQGADNIQVLTILGATTFLSNLLDFVRSPLVSDSLDLFIKDLPQFSTLNEEEKLAITDQIVAALKVSLLQSGVLIYGAQLEASGLASTVLGQTYGVSSIVTFLDLEKRDTLKAILSNSIYTDSLAMRLKELLEDQTSEVSLPDINKSIDKLASQFKGETVEQFQELVVEELRSRGVLESAILPIRENIGSFLNNTLNFPYQTLPVLKEEILSKSDQYVAGLSSLELRQPVKEALINTLNSPVVNSGEFQVKFSDEIRKLNISAPQAEEIAVDISSRIFANIPSSLNPLQNYDPKRVLSQPEIGESLNQLVKTKLEEAPITLEYRNKLADKATQALVDSQYELNRQAKNLKEISPEAFEVFAQNTHSVSKPSAPIHVLANELGDSILTGSEVAQKRAVSGKVDNIRDPRNFVRGGNDMQV